MIKKVCYVLLLASQLIAANVTASKELSAEPPSPSHHPSLSNNIKNICPECAAQSSQQTATLILDKGATALYTRAWLTNHSEHSIDIQYFIWSEDNIGILAMEALLQAANRGVVVRIIVDDFLIDADFSVLLALEAHPNIHIKIYNPKHKVGVSTFTRVKNLTADFRDSNQRMHDKLAIFDDTIAITGGRNMADEYFDFDNQYSFRDRDVLVHGKATTTMKTSFERFWNSDLSLALSQLLADELAELTPKATTDAYNRLSNYANDPNNFSEEVKHAIHQFPTTFNTVLDEMRWSDAYFIYDYPGKNDGQSGLGGGGKSTDEIIKLLNRAEKEIIIQSPYLIMPPEVITFFKTLINKNISIKISTNSLASTDNLMAYSGYHNIRDQLLEIGIALYEYKPAPQNQAELHHRYLQLKDSPPIFALHAKSMVIDRKTALIGTFNFDPRSINLNTEVGMVIPDATTANELYQLITDDMKAENSWHILKNNNPDSEVSLWKRIKLTLLKWLPLEPVL
ncbi:Phospholipase D/Transphosphatidylase [gamma proteobacterium IMCC1989]|nr:Phospholipase D/Transphosphatidylase [gamma proteobacterium IMCC1989]